MRQATRAARAVTVALALLAVALPAAGTPFARAAAADLTPTGQRAFSELAGCVAAGRPLFAQFVVDESQSLETTDPGAARRVALLTAIDALADLDRQHAGTVHASLATFAKGYVPRVGWGRLDERHLNALRSLADQEIPRLHRGVATDYTEALTQAAASLRQAVRTSDACQAVVFFTDGGLDVGHGTTANKDALTRLCQPNGIADALRRQGVHLLAFGLLPKDGSGADTSKRDRERLQAMAEGRGGAFSCGTLPVGPSRAGGAYLPAERADRLRALFESAVARISGFTPDVDVVCPVGTCRGGRLRIPVDPGIAVVRLVVVPENRVDLSLIAPSGHSLGLPESEGIRRVLDGAGVTSRSTSSIVRVDLDLPAEAPRGDWTLAVRNGAEPGRAPVQVYRGSGLTLRLTPAALTATAGATTRYSVSVVDRTGAVADPARWQTFALTARAGAGSRQALTRSGDAWSGTLDVPRTGFPLSLPLTLTLDLVTKPNLLRLAPVTVQTTVMVEPPASLPSVGPARLVLPDVVGAGDTRGTLQVRGSDQGPTEVCVGQPPLHGPPQAGEFAVSTGRRCVALARDERTSVTLTVDPSGKADGLVEGTLPVALRGSRAGERAHLDVPVQFGMRRPVDEATRWELSPCSSPSGCSSPCSSGGPPAAKPRGCASTSSPSPTSPWS
ncbi:MAG TPA: vWA domain-containing protein [Mycobacteriales bacterium]|nr:vWA domain-containing protein [Mycobacteriales bacterium]